MLALRLLWLRRLSLLCVGMTIVLMALGAWVKATGSGLACPDWPQCYGEWLPPFPSEENGGTYQGEPVPYSQAQVLYEWGHRAVVSLLLLPLGALAFLALRSPDAHRLLRTLPVVAFVLYFAQAGLGAVTVVTGNPAWATTAHMVLATIFLTTLVATATVAQVKPEGEPLPPPVEAPKPRQVAFVYRDEAGQGPAGTASETEAQNG